jgi:hypothetical protein
MLVSYSYPSKNFGTFRLAETEAFDITAVQTTKQPNINMPLERFFLGTSPGGNLQEAIQNALKEARKTHTVDKKWVIKKIAENQLTFPPLTVVIRVGGGRGDNGVGPR